MHRFITATIHAPRIAALTILFVSTAAPAFAQPGISSYTALHTTGTMTIDGKLDDPDWARAQEFTMTETNTGKPVPLKSTVKMLWDDEYLYFGFYSEDPDAWATLFNEDDPLWGEEVVEVFIDPEGLGHSYYEHEVNPVNVKVDLFIVNAGEARKGIYKGWKDWDFSAKLKQAVFVEGDGKLEGTADKYLTVEIAFPFEDLWTAPRVPPRDGDMWRIGCYRIERGKSGDRNDDWYAAFSPTLRPSFHTPWRFGKVTFKK